MVTPDAPPTAPSSAEASASNWRLVPVLPASDGAAVAPSPSPAERRSSSFDEEGGLGVSAGFSAPLISDISNDGYTTTTGYSYLAGDWGRVTTTGAELTSDVRTAKHCQIY
jgi:hypothetical protein